MHEGALADLSIGGPSVATAFNSRLLSEKHTHASPSAAQPTDNFKFFCCDIMSTCHLLISQTDSALVLQPDDPKALASSHFQKSLAIPQRTIANPFTSRHQRSAQKYEYRDVRNESK